MPSARNMVIVDGPAPSTTDTPTAHSSAMTYRADIDGLRAVAILLVVVYHAGFPGAGGGYIGVDVFFVLSGFLITSVIVDQSARSQFSLVGFYAGRARRLLPQSLLTLVTTVAVGIWLLPPIPATELIDDARSAVLYVANWRYADKAVAYVDTEVADSLLVHYWSLAVEEQFYFFWPLLIIAGALLQRRIERRLPRVSLRAVVFTLAAAVTVISFVLSVRLTATEGSRAYYLTHLRLWEMSAGALVAMRPSFLRQSATPRPVAQAIALGAICIVGFAYDDATPFPGSAAVIPVIATMALLGIGGRSSSVDTILGSRPMTYIGMRSFAWYLWHWPALGFAHLIADRYALDLDEPTIVGIALIVSFGVADITHRFVENPIRFSDRLKPYRWLAVLCTLAVMATLTLAATNVRSQVLSGVAAAWSDASTSPEDAIADVASREFGSCHRGLAQEPAAREVEWCVAGDPDGGQTVVLLGDSHAQHWAPGIDEAGQINGWRVLISTRSSCLAYGAPMYNARLEVMDEACYEWGRNAEKLIEDEDVDLLIVARARAYFNAIRSDEGAELADDEVAQLVTKSYGTFLQNLEDHVGHVLLLDDTPWASYNVPNCLAEKTPRTAEECDFDAVETPVETQLLAAEAAAIAASPAGFASITSFDELVCPSAMCDVVRPDGVFVYRDQHHITATYSRLVGPGVGDAIRDLVAAGTERNR